MVEMVPEMGPGHRAGGADLASGVGAAGTVVNFSVRIVYIVYSLKLSHSQRSIMSRL